MQTIIKQTVVRPGMALLWPSRIIARIRNATEIPLGYQDETGFHFGHEPDVVESSQQSFQDPYSK